jgi:hypothetical protein
MNGKNTNKDGLENYFDGEENWKNFAKIYKKIETENTNELLTLLNHNIELANSIEGLIGNNSVNWLYRHVPALNNLRPIDCINDEKLLKRLKECLMRMG